MGRRQPPEGRGRATGAMPGDESVGLAARGIPAIMSCVRPGVRSRLIRPLKRVSFEDLGRLDGRTHGRHRGTGVARSGGRLGSTLNPERGRRKMPLHVDGLSVVTRDQALQQASRVYHMKDMIIDALEKRLVEALKSVDAHGDVAPAHVHDPMTMLLRENVVRDNLVRWDDVRGRYVLTGTGRRRIIQGSRAPGAVVSFRNRGVVGSGVQYRKSSNNSLKE